MILGWQQADDGTWHALVSAWHLRASISPRTTEDRCAAPALTMSMNTAQSTSWPGLDSAPNLTRALLDAATPRYRHSAGVGPPQQADSSGW